MPLPSSRTACNPASESRTRPNKLSMATAVPTTSRQTATSKAGRWIVLGTRIAGFSLSSRTCTDCTKAASGRGAAAISWVTKRSSASGGISSRSSSSMWSKSWGIIRFLLTQELLQVVQCPAEMARYGALIQLEYCCNLFVAQFAKEFQNDYFLAAFWQQRNHLTDPGCLLGSNSRLLRRSIRRWYGAVFQKH